MSLGSGRALAATNRAGAPLAAVSGNTTVGDVSGTTRRSAVITGDTLVAACLHAPRRQTRPVGAAFVLVAATTTATLMSTAT